MTNGWRALWLHVLQQAFMDATAEASGPDRGHREAADRWIRGCGRDFRHVCSLAGMDADFLSGAYRAGRVNPVWLRHSPRLDNASDADRKKTAQRNYRRKLREASRYAF